MNDLTLKDILEDISREEYEEFEKMTDVPNHRFSFRHRRKMKKILAPKQPESRYLKSLPPTKRVALIMMTILFALVSMVSAGAAINGFLRREYSDNTQFFVAYPAGSPITIEHEYYLPNPPSGYEQSQKERLQNEVITYYTNAETDKVLIFSQQVRDSFDEHFDNERSTFEDINLNGHYGIYINFKNEGESFLVWDNEDYVLEISGPFTKEELMNLAKSAKY